ncbi:hypothetical protein ACQKEK_02330 [Pseudomonas sp. NPDC077408]|uniref:hypothetical protein n=1 Tax=Streptomyces parvus TaxID=66428 RepID=UPI00372424E9
MDDRELLEMAAKAAGIEVIRIDDPGAWIAGGGGIYWNPLTDDGDALRLAESLGFTICMNGSGTVSASDDYDKSVFATQSIHECGGNRLAATRRAIVRAAAAIGRAM